LIGKDNRELSSNVFVVTDDDLLGSDVVTFVEACGFQVIWFRSASGYLAHTRSQVPSCLLISSRLSDMSGFDFQLALAGNEHPPIIFLSDDGDIPSCVRVIKSGAHDFLRSPFLTSHLLRAINAAVLADQAALERRRAHQDLRDRWHSLTPREAEVMRYVVNGFLNKQTAAELRIVENTVQVHRGRVMRKMGADTFAELIRMSLTLADWGEASLLHT
jgi:FixJ family two-component response regulator